MAGLGPSLAEDLLPDRVEGGHDAGADFGVVAAVQVPFALGVGEGAQRAALVDAAAAGLEVDLAPRPWCGRTAPAARPAASVGPPPAGRARRRCWPPAASAMAHACSADRSPRRAAAAVSGRDSRRRAVSMAAAAWTTLVPVRRASWCAAERSPSVRHEPHLGHPGRGQGLDGGGHLLDPRRLLHHIRGLGCREHGRVEAGGVLTQRFPQFCDPHAHSRCQPSENERPTGGSGTSRIRTGVRILPLSGWNASTIPQKSPGSRPGRCRTPARS